MEKLKSEWKMNTWHGRYKEDAEGALACAVDSDDIARIFPLAERIEILTVKGGGRTLETFTSTS